MVRRVPGLLVRRVGSWRLGWAPGNRKSSPRLFSLKDSSPTDRLGEGEAGGRRRRQAPPSSTSPLGGLEERVVSETKTKTKTEKRQRQKPGRRQKRIVAKCANPLNLLLLLLPPLKEVERLPRRLRWTRRWRRLVVVVVQQTVVGHGGIVVVDVVVVVGGVVVVEEIVGRAGDGFCSSQVGQEAPGEGGASFQTAVCQNHILSPPFRSCQKVKRMYLPTTHQQASSNAAPRPCIQTPSLMSHGLQTGLASLF